MGQVIQSFHHTCVVRLVTDGQSKVGVTFGPAERSTPGIVDGQGPGNSMTADLVPPHTPLHKGEVMFTSGLRGGGLPAGDPGGHRCVVPHRGGGQPGDASRSTRRPT